MITVFKNKSKLKFNKNIASIRLDKNSIFLSKAAVDFVSLNVNVGEDAGGVYIANGKSKGEYTFQTRKGTKTVNLCSKDLANKIRSVFHIKYGTPCMFNLDLKKAKDEHETTWYKLVEIK